MGHFHLSKNDQDRREERFARDSLAECSRTFRARLSNSSSNGMHPPYTDCHTFASIWKRHRARLIGTAQPRREEKKGSSNLYEREKESLESSALGADARTTF